jgi:hypothetical protein
MEPEDSTALPQEPATFPYPTPDISSPRPIQVFKYRF